MNYHTAVPQPASSCCAPAFFYASACFFLFVRCQLVIESRVTSDDLQQAVSANTDKIVAVQSSVDSALGDNFRRTQDMVQSQV